MIQILLSGQAAHCQGLAVPNGEATQRRLLRGCSTRRGITASGSAHDNGHAVQQMGSMQSDMRIPSEPVPLPHLRHAHDNEPALR